MPIEVCASVQSAVDTGSTEPLCLLLSVKVEPAMLPELLSFEICLASSCQSILRIGQKNQPVAVDDSRISNEDKLCINQVSKEIRNRPSNTKCSVVQVDDSAGESSDVDIPAEAVRRHMNFDIDEDDCPMEQSNSESD